MLNINSILQATLLLLYGLLLGCGLTIFFKQLISHKALFFLTVCTAVVHTIYIGTYTLAMGHCLLTTASEIFSLIAFTMLVTYIIVEARPDNTSVGTGIMIMAVAFLFQLISSIATNRDLSSSINPIFLDPSFNIHVASIVFGYAALTLSTIYGSLYLILYRTMQKNRFGKLFNELPSLSKLERYGLRALLVGFIFLSISIVFGIVLLHNNFSIEETRSYLKDPKTIATLLVWFVFGLTLILRRIMKVEGRKLVLIWMSGYILTLLSMTIVNAFGTEYHNFL